MKRADTNTINIHTNIKCCVIQPLHPDDTTITLWHNLLPIRLSTFLSISYDTGCTDNYTSICLYQLPKF